MKLDDIRSPGLVPNTHRLRQEVVRAISFAEVLKSSEKATDLVLFFRDAIAYLDKEVGSEASPESEKVAVDAGAASPFDDVDLPKPAETPVVPFGLVEPTPEPEPEPKPKAAPKSTAKKGK